MRSQDGRDHSYSYMRLPLFDVPIIVPAEKAHPDHKHAVKTRNEPTLTYLLSTLGTRRLWFGKTRRSKHIASTRDVVPFVNVAHVDQYYNIDIVLWGPVVYWPNGVKGSCPTLVWHMSRSVMLELQVSAGQFVLVIIKCHLWTDLDTCALGSHCCLNMGNFLANNCLWPAMLNNMKHKIHLQLTPRSSLCIIV